MSILDKYHESIDYFLQAIQNGNKHIEASSFFALGESCFKTNQIQKSLTAVVEARKLYIELGLINHAKDCENTIESLLPYFFRV